MAKKEDPRNVVKFATPIQRRIAERLGAEGLKFQELAERLVMEWLDGKHPPPPDFENLKPEEKHLLRGILRMWRAETKDQTWIIALKALADQWDTEQTEPPRRK